MIDEVNRWCPTFEAWEFLANRIFIGQQKWIDRTMRASETGVLQLAMVTVGPGSTP